MIAWIFIIIGLVIMIFGLIGMIILPDFLLRIHSSTKCGVTGALNILIGFMIYSGRIEFVVKLLLVVLFLFVTSPLTAHLLSVFHLQEKDSDKTK